MMKNPKSAVRRIGALPAALAVGLFACNVFAQDTPEPEPAPEEEVDWIDVENDKGIKLEIQIIEIKDERVLFRTKSGKEYALPVTKFNPDSREIILLYAKDKAAEKEEEHEKATADWRVTARSESAQRSIYTTTHFEIGCDTQLSTNIVSRFTPHMEGAYQGVRSLPLAIVPKARDDLFKIRVLATDDDFRVVVRSRLPSKAVGIYDHSNRTLMLPLSRLNIKRRGDSFVVPESRANPPLVHESTLLVMQDQLESLPPWLVKGAAEYLAAARYEKNQLVFTGHNKNIANHIRTFYGVKDGLIPMLTVDDLLLLNYASWMRGDEATVDKQTYSSLLLFYFFADLDYRGKNLKAYSRAMQQHDRHDDAFKDLLNGRSVEQLTSQLKKALSARGLAVRM